MCSILSMILQWGVNPKHSTTKSTTKSNHVKDLTAESIELTTELNHEPLLRLLSSGDVASNELFYHDKCYDTIRYQYSKFTKSKSNESSSMHNIECRQIALKKVFFFWKTAKCLIQEICILWWSLKQYIPTYLNLTTFIIITILLLSLTYW